jgi:hypothetical protein
LSARIWMGCSESSGSALLCKGISASVASNSELIQLGLRSAELVAQHDGMDAFFLAGEQSE